MLFLRRERDSNPWIPYEINGFRDRPIRPLWHLSEEGVSVGVGVGVESVGKRQQFFHTHTHAFFAEREGFEPPEACTSTVFKTAAIDHSAISPGAKVQRFSKLPKIVRNKWLSG